MLIRDLCNKIEKIYAFDYKERITCEKNFFENSIIIFWQMWVLEMLFKF